MNMEHKSKKLIEDVSIEYTCDLCGARASGRKCCICGIDVCDEHAHREYDKWGGDRSDKYCVDCWEIGEPFREKMKETENRLYNEVDNINKEWRNTAMDNRKKKSDTKNDK